ncbi:transcriptional regulator, IclR family [Glycomyces sambucus]|uniref:Transcriptional regulator, IclR family n=1 Tax=Glycomyces sambucus TaxID=380244 RepID=A0A1G9IJK7_9ACTN|nr:IclR family transcriptional regulator [Glycomyces sambucus]SDL25418.1 transcriptional regulator, IclR family [Glycomyces sambucus]
MPRAQAPPKGSLDRALEIFDVLTARGTATTAELVAAVGASRSAVYRLVERLQAAEYLTAADGRWRLGPAAARMAMAAVQHMDVFAAAPPLLRDLAAGTGETVNLGVLSGDEIVFVFRELGRHAVQVRSELGARRPLHATAVGKAYLSGLAPDRCDALIAGLRLERFTDATITDPDALRAEIAATRRRGWSEERGEFDAGSTCFGAPVFEQSGEVAAAVSVAGPTARIADAAFGPLAAEAAGTVSRRLGYVRPEG